MSGVQWDSLRVRLDEVHRWPSQFTYKFIMPQEVVPSFVPILGDRPYTTRQSNRGNYTSITVEVEAQSSEQVVELYVAASRIEKVIAL